MKYLTIGLISLILINLIFITECKSRKKHDFNEILNSSENIDYYEDDELEPLDDDEHAKLKQKKIKTKNKRLSKKKKDDEFEYIYEDDDPIIVCKGSKKNICECNGNQLKCDKVLIDNKPLESLDIQVYDDEFIVKTAIITNNKISKLEKDYILADYTPYIQKLDLSNNLITHIEGGAFNDFNDLIELRLSNNKLERINYHAFNSELSGLHKLFLDNNNIKIINQNSFKDLTELKFLVLDNNPELKLLKKPFPSTLKNLEKLSLDYCNIKKLDDSIFSNLVNLKELSLVGNQLISIPKAINALPSLTGLDLSETSLTEINTDEITSDHKLEELRMLNMPYLYIIQDCSFCGLPNLKKLNLQNSTQLYDFNENAFGTFENTAGDYKVPELIELNLKNCSFKKLAPELISWEKIEKLSLSGNPFECDCEMSWLINEKTLHHFDDMPICNGPGKFTNKTFSQVSGEICINGEINHSSKTTRNFTISFLVLLAVICFIGLFLVYTRRIRITNTFYRPEVPNMGYRNLTVQQNREDESELRDDFTPRPDASL